MKKVKGFNPSAEEQESDDHSQKGIIQIINMRYDNAGDPHKLVYKTSRELRFEYREMLNSTISEITNAMIEAGYEMKIINDHPHWVMFDKIKEPNDF